MAKCDSEFDDLIKVKLYSSQQCQENEVQIYPKIIEYLKSEKPVIERTEVVGILLNKVGHCTQSEIFVQDLDIISACIVSLFDSSLNVKVSDFESSNCLLENGRQLIEYFTTYIKFLISSQQYMLQFVTIGLSLIERSYSHCSKCSELYGDFLEDFKDKLQKLVTQSHALQVQLLVYLDNIQANNSETFQHSPGQLTSILNELYAILRPLTETMEVKATVPIWKVYAKMVFQFQDVLIRSDQFEISSVLNYLCFELIRLINGDMVTVSPNQASGLLKLCSFLFKLLISFCNKFRGCTTNSIGDILELSLALLKASPPNLSSKMGSEFFTEYRQVLLVGLNPMVEHVLCDEQFATALLALDPKKNDALSLCLLHIMVLDLLPSSENDCVERFLSDSDYSIVTRVFQTMELCSEECLLPIYLDGVMCRGKPQHYVSLFHFVCMHLCSFVSSLPRKHFQKVEICLFSYVLGTNPINSLLARDIFCFIARFSTSDLCLSHCSIFAKLVLSLPEHSVSAVNVSSLLRRLVSFLGSGHRRQLLTTFSSTYLTNLLEVHQPNPNVDFIPNIEQWNSLTQLNTSLETLEANARVNKILNINEQKIISNIVRTVLSSSSFTVLAELVLNKICRILTVVNDVDADVSIQLAECVRAGASRGVESAYLVLDALVRVFISRPLSNESVQLVSQCLAICLNSSNVLLQEMSFERFALISHPVLNVELIRQTIKLCSQKVSHSIKGYIKAFISRNMTHPNKQELVRFISEPQKISERNDCEGLISFDLFGMDLEEVSENEVKPPSKKPRPASQISAALERLSEVVQCLQEACGTSQMDVSQLEELKVNIKNLNQLL